MDRAFTLRLSEEEVTALEELKKIGDEKTDSKIIRYIILRFNDVCKELRIEIERNRQLTAELKELKGKVKEFNQALMQLSKVE